MCENSKEVFRYRKANGNDMTIGGFEYCTKAKSLTFELAKNNRNYAKILREFSQQTEYTCLADYYFYTYKVATS